ncbi:hypothetical protein EBU99_13895 [bacterium]|nr:hypothetical protein [bacterium]
MNTVAEYFTTIKENMQTIGEAVGVFAVGIGLGVMGAIRKKNALLKHNKTKEKRFVQHHSQIHELLTEMRVTIRASRCLVFQFHNGGSFADGTSIKRFSVTHESCAAGVTSMILESQDVLLSRCVDIVRIMDESASKNDDNRIHPRDSILRHQPGDSKPAVWWNVKYKNKFLLDGSVVAGNPIFTNLLWNEIGRGSDLTELSRWLDDNSQVVQELTAAVFSAEAPQFLDFFPVEHFDLSTVKKGQQLFQENCAMCHGNYIKGYQRSNSNGLSNRELLATVKVEYHRNTPVVNVGTDPLRAQGMSALAEPLNRLAISKKNGIVVEVQRGYVPPPLVGIWARWPYLHNNSVPSLCSLLTPALERPVQWDVGEAHSTQTDFDSQCNGYPLGEKAPQAWKKNRWGHFDTRRRGMSNVGHDEGIFSENGRSKFSSEDRQALIQFLQTL